MLIQSWLDAIERRCNIVMSKTKTSERVRTNVALNSMTPNTATMWLRIAFAVPLVSAAFASDNFWVQAPCVFGAINLVLTAIRLKNAEWVINHVHFALNEEIMIRDQALSSYLTAMMTELGDDEADKNAVVESFMKMSAAARNEIIKERNSHRTN
jgi:hypothetical protein